MKVVKIIFLIVICVMLALPVANMDLRHNVSSPIDNRVLTEWDLSGGISTAPGMADSYLNDRIGYRTRAITDYIQLNDEIFGMMIHPIYTYGKDGHVFFKPAYETVDQEFIDSFCAFIRQAQDYCEERGVPFIYCLNPSKISIYTEYLPEGYIYRDLFNQAMCAKLDEYGVNYVTNEGLMKEKSRSEQVYNKKYDVGHWNDVGCFYGTNNMLSKVNEYFPAVRENTGDDFVVIRIKKRSLPGSYFKIYEEIPYYVEKDFDYIENISADYSGIRLNDQHRTYGMMRNRKPGSEELPDVLFFKGSYYNKKNKFFESRFHDSYTIHNYENFLDLDYYFNIFQPDCVILETAEYATNANYFNRIKLGEKKLNPKFDPEEYSSLMEPIGNYDFETETAGNLTVITVKGVELDKAGYLIIGDKVFDFIREGDTMSCTINKKYFEDDMMVCFKVLN